MLVKFGWCLKDLLFYKRFEVVCWNLFKELYLELLIIFLKVDWEMNWIYEGC